MSSITAIEPHIYTAAEHGVRPEDVSEAARTTIAELTRAGFQAYVVGGGVRDMLLGLHPKDFDIATDATPDQIKRVFGRQCQIIGRRFQLAHVYQGRHLLEVATFRAPHDQHSAHSQTSAHGMLVRDNIWGTIDQDALRRDFTINAMYYQPETGEIWDFADGMHDLQEQTLRIIGDPATRYREDPVRMLRGVRIAAKLGFGLDRRTTAPISQLADLLAAISAHRLYDECHKMFGCGQLEVLLDQLHALGLLKPLFPHLKAATLESPLVNLAARNTDERLQQGKSINPAFFYAVLLWDWHQQITRHLLDEGEELIPAYQAAGLRVLTQQSQHTAIPRHVAQTIREIWDLQPRLQKPRSRLVPKLVTQPRFRAGFDFLLLREQAGDPHTEGMGEWWEHYQAASTDEQEQMLRQLDRPKPRPKSKARKAAPHGDDAGAA